MSPFDVAPAKGRLRNPWHGWYAVPARLLNRATLSLLCGVQLCAALAPARAHDPCPKSDSFLRQAMSAKPTSGWSSVILQAPGELTTAHKNQIRSLGGYVYRHLPFIRAAAVRLPSRNLPRLAALPFVQRLSADATVWKSDEFTVGSSGADLAFRDAGLTGAGIGVAVVDSGIQPGREDLRDESSGRPRTIAGVSFVPGSTSSADPCGHGTHVAGIVAGNGSASSGSQYFRTFYGIARRANLVNVRVLDARGRGAVSDVIKALDWIIAHKTTYNIRVINLSLGHPVGESYATDPLCRAVEKAYRAGVVVVIAAGNRGRIGDTPRLLRDNEGYGTAYGTIQSPANSPYAITVGAMKATAGGRAYDRVATYSSRGPSRLDFVLKPDIVAPGNRVISVSAENSYLFNGYPANRVAASEYSTGGTGGSNTYFRLSGTSMATPVVSGAVALMLQADPTLSPDTVKARLMFSADKWWGLGNGTTDPCTFGAGYLNIPAALRSTLVATRPALSPALYRDPFGLVYVNTQQIVSDSGIWGTGVWGLGGVYGSQVLWGETTLGNSQVLWGESVWADQVLWGESTGAADLSSTAILGEN